MKNKIKTTISFALILLISIVIVGSIYYYTSYPKQDFDVILYTFSNGIENTSPSVVKNVIFSCILPLILVLIALTLPIVKKTKSNIYLNIYFWKKQKTIQLFPIKITSKHRITYIVLLIIISFFIFIKSFNIDEYIKNKMQNTKIFETYYVDARNISIKFPKQKRNLILILGESFENTVFSKENGGAWNYSIMPELEKLSIENTNFSNSNKIGGPLQIYGTTYSAAGNVAITSGIPLKVQEFFTNENSYTGNGKYLDGVYSLGEFLNEQNYNLEIIMGSDGTFGGRKQYYETNGNYKVFDLNYAIEQGKMAMQDYVWWGFEDDKLYEWSKEEITKLSKDSKPFNYVMLTADTHFMDGYLSPNAETKYKSQYENVHAYSSKCINNFVNWIKKQDFYENTTIVIVGDHLGMQNEFYEDKIKENVTREYTRTIYNVIINSAIDAKNNKNRLFTSMDMFPTILASIGVEIEGNRLGLGTNLYSNVPTLIEEIGYDYFDDEIKKNSAFYNKHIIGDDYYIIKKQKESGKNDEKNNNSNTSI